MVIDNHTKLWLKDNKLNKKVRGNYMGQRRNYVYQYGSAQSTLYFTYLVILGVFLCSKKSLKYFLTDKYKLYFKIKFY